MSSTLRAPLVCQNLRSTLCVPQKSNSISNLASSLRATSLSLVPPGEKKKARDLVFILVGPPEVFKDDTCSENFGGRLGVLWKQHRIQSRKCFPIPRD